MLQCVAVCCSVRQCSELSAPQNVFVHIDYSCVEVDCIHVACLEFYGRAHHCCVHDSCVDEYGNQYRITEKLSKVINIVLLRRWLSS